MSDLTDLTAALDAAVATAGDGDEWSVIRTEIIAICTAVKAYATATFSE